MSVRLSVQVLEARKVPASLFVGDQPMAQTKANYLATIKYLTVPPAAQTGPVFDGTDMAAIKKMEDPLRRQVFNAMDLNPARTFHFADLAAAERNVEMRIDIIEFMNAVSRQGDPTANTLGLDFSYFNSTHPPTANPVYWTPVPYTGPVPSREFRYTGSDAYDAIRSIVQAPYVGECLGAAEIAVLYSAAEVMGQSAFNQMFPTGLLFGPQETSQAPSVMTLLPQQLYAPPMTRITRPDMVPGDFVYMQNRDDYFTKTNGTGYWNGENAIYMGRYDLVSGGLPEFKTTATPRFSGLGLYDQSESQLRKDLWTGYCHDVRNVPEGSPVPPMPADSGIRWTVDAGPGTDTY